MTAREPKFTDPEEAVLIARSKALIAEMEELIARAKRLTREHRQVAEELRMRRDSEKNPTEEAKD